jgi:mannose-6-phosphate isomerase-like protein (cupin superfamily)
MFNSRQTHGGFKGRLLSALTFASLMVFSGLQADEPALAFTANAEELEWGPCPAFIPKGCEIAVLHGDPGKHNADLFFKVPGNFAIPHHWHTSPERIVLVSGKMTVTYDDQATEVLEVGTYAYGPAKRPHVAFCEKGEDCVLFIAFEDPVDAFEVIKAVD